FGGRTWSVVARARPTPSILGGWMLVLWVGTAISMLLSALTWSLVSTRARAIRLGTNMAQRFRKLNELLPCLVLLVRKEDGEIIYRNAAASSKPPDESAWSRLSSSPLEQEAATLLEGDEVNRPESRDIQIKGV